LLSIIVACEENVSDENLRDRQLAAARDVRQSLHRPLRLALTMKRHYLYLAVALAGVASAKSPDRGLRFDSPNVLDLSAHTLDVKLDSALDIAPLAADEAARIAAAPTLTDEEKAILSLSDDVYGCQTPAPACSTAGDKKRISESGGRVKREGAALRIGAATFIDWKQPETKSADGESEKHWYLGTLHGNGYDRVEVEFGHDSPGNFLINPANGKIAFVHNGSDVVALSPDGKFMLTYDQSNTPLSIRIAALDANGPTLAVLCSGDSDANTHVEFRGWRDAAHVDLAVVSHGARSRLAKANALQFAWTTSGWTLAAAEPEALRAIHFVCRQQG
jgi:hypothetical protein